MIIRMRELPADVIGFKIVGGLIKSDFDFIINELKRYFTTHENARYVLVFENTPTDFALGTWLHRGLITLRDSIEWTKAALVADSERLMRYAIEFEKSITGEIKAFATNDFAKAINWTKLQ